jgi:integrase
MNNNDDLRSDDSDSEPVGDRVRIFRRGQVWYANFQDGGKQHRLSLRTSSKKEARRRALKIAHDLEAGRWKPASVPTTIAEGIEAYQNFLRAEGRAPKTLGKYNKVFERVLDLSNDREITELSGIDLKFVDAYKGLRTDKGAKLKTIYTEAVIIRQLINFALVRDMILNDPLKGIRLRKPKPTPQPCWTYQQVQTILANSPETVQRAFTLLAETGMRFGELAWLTWDDIDLKANVLHIRAKEGWKPKTGDQRSVPLSEIARAVLQSLPRRGTWVVTMPSSRTHRQAGRQWTERRLLDALKRILRKLNLLGKLHTFRHYFISNALMQGMPEATVRKWVGQVDEEILKLYTHIHDRASQAAMQRLGEANHKELQREENADERTDADRDAAQNQHTRKEAGDGQGAK